MPTLHPLKVKPVNRKEVSAFRIYFWHLVQASIPFLLAPVLLGSAGLMILGVTRALSKTPIGHLSPSNVVVAALICSTLALVLFAAVYEPLRITIDAIDLVQVRILSIFVSGLSDVLGLVKTTPLAYGLATVIAWVNAYGFERLVFEGTPIGDKIRTIAAGSPPDIGVPAGLWISFCFASEGLLLLVALRLTFTKRWHALASRPRMEQWTSTRVGPLSADLDDDNVIVIHGSDLHCGHDKVSGPALRLKLEKISRDESVDAIVLSGDLTDTGSQAGWDDFVAAVDIEAARSKVVMAPGNHDLNLVFEGFIDTAIHLESINKNGTNIRALLYLRAANAVMGDRTTVLSPFDGEPTSLKSVMEHAEKQFVPWDTNVRKLPKDSLTPFEIFVRVFPMVVETRPSRGSGGRVKYVVWNTIKHSDSPIFNAIGEIDEAQLERAEALLSSSQAGGPVVHVMHHQIALPIPKSGHRAKPMTPKQWIQSTGLSFQNPSEVLDWLAKRSQDTLVLHGHHHKLFMLANPRARTQLVSAPSMTVGNEESFIHGVVPGNVGQWLKLQVRVDGANAILEQVEVQHL